MRRYRYLAMMMVGVLAFAACGGDDDDDSSSPSAQDDSSGDDDSGDNSSSDDNGDDSSADDNGDDDNAVTEEDLEDLEDAAGLFTDEECAAAVTAMIGAAAAAGTAFGGGDSEVDDSLDLLQEYADKAPDEIKDDLQTVYEGYASFVQAMQDSGFDPESGDVPDADALAALEEATQSLDTEEFQAASEHVSEWFDTECSQG